MEVRGRSMSSLSSHCRARPRMRAVAARAMRRRRAREQREGDEEDGDESGLGGADVAEEVDAALAEGVVGLDPAADGDVAGEVVVGGGPGGEGDEGQEEGEAEPSEQGVAAAGEGWAGWRAHVVTVPHGARRSGGGCRWREGARSATLARGAGRERRSWGSRARGTSPGRWWQPGARRLSRRSFLRAAGRGGVAVAGLALVGVRGRRRGGGAVAGGRGGAAGGGGSGRGGRVAAPRGAPKPGARRRPRRARQPRWGRPSAVACCGCPRR